MWYFSWILGLGLACALAVINAMWYELFSESDAYHALHDPEVDQSEEKHTGV